MNGVGPCGIKSHLARRNVLPERVTLACLLTSLVLLLHTPYANEQIVTPLAFVALLSSKVRTNGYFWIGVAGFRILSQIPSHWETLDNHQYLISWWCLGLGLALLAANVDEAVRVSARLLVGLCFLYALVWKLRSTEFLSGNFMAWRLTTDSRFREFAQTFLELPSSASDSNRNTLRSIQLEPMTDAILVTTGTRVRSVAIIVSWYTVIIEASVAILYLLPQRFDASKYAHLALFLFIISVYPIAPVVGFALVLLALSVATMRDGSRSISVAIGLFIVLPLFKEFEQVFALF